MFSSRPVQVGVPRRSGPKHVLGAHVQKYSSGAQRRLLKQLEVGSRLFTNWQHGGWMSKSQKTGGSSGHAIPKKEPGSFNFGSLRLERNNGIAAQKDEWRGHSVRRSDHGLPQELFDVLTCPSFINLPWLAGESNHAPWSFVHLRLAGLQRTAGLYPILWLST